MDEVEVRGLRIAYRRAGQGPPLVLVHGALSDSRAWRRQLEGLADELTVVAWDAPGCGGSSDPPPGFRLPDYADCLAGFVTALGLERPCVLGLSFGGGLVLELYRRHPQLPGALVLASAYAGWAGSLPAEEVRARVDRALAEAQRPPREWAEGYLPGLFAAEVPPEVRQETLDMLLDTRPAGMVAMARSFAEADLRDVLPRVAVPTLLVYGERDTRSPLPVARELHAAIPGAQLVVLPGAGHESNVEAPEAFDAAVRGFVRSSLRRP